MAADHTGRAHGAAEPVLVAVLVLAVGWNLLVNLVVPGDWYLPVNLLGAALVLAVGRRAGLSRGELGVGRADLRDGLLFGLGAVLVVAAVLALALAVPGVSVWLEVDDVERASMATRWFRPLVRIPLGTVVFEEVLFRSVIFGLVARARGSRWAIGASSVAFGLWHIVPAAETADGSSWQVAGAVVVTVAVTSAAGLVFAALRHRSGSVVAPMLAHTATNSLAYVAAIVAIEVLR